MKTFVNHTQPPKYPIYCERERESLILIKANVMGSFATFPQQGNLMGSCMRPIFFPLIEGGSFEN